jgi:predicted molibdopterin-dependent oxidoreductase YjgC
MTDQASLPTTHPDTDETVSFTLDGRPVTARPGELLIARPSAPGTYIPRFCYHPRMEPVGMCRMCLVEVSGPARCDAAAGVLHPGRGDPRSSPPRTR